MLWFGDFGTKYTLGNLVRCSFFSWLVRVRSAVFWRWPYVTVILSKIGFSEITEFSFMFSFYYGGFLFFASYLNMMCWCNATVILLECIKQAKLESLRHPDLCPMTCVRARGWVWTLGSPSWCVFAESVCLHMLLFDPVVAFYLLLSAGISPITALSTLHSSVVEKNIEELNQRDNTPS